GPSGSVCLPKLAGGIGPCVVRSGDLQCPSPFTVKSVFFDGKGVKDDRGCEPASCTCGAPSGSTCDCGAGCAVDLYADSSCAMLRGGGRADGGCVSVRAQPQSAEVVGGTATGGASPPSGTASSKGAAVPTGPVTLCCLP